MVAMNSVVRLIKPRFGVRIAATEDSILPSNYNECLSEEHFRNMLALELNRSQRFGAPFMLMLLDVSRLLGARQKAKTEMRQRLVSVLVSGTRVIDVKGWYIFDYLLGIIFTNVNESQEDAMTGKLGNMLLSQLDEWSARDIQMMCMFYPNAQDCTVKEPLESVMRMKG